MKRLFTILCITFATLFLSACGRVVSEKGFRNISYENALATAKESGKIVMLDFTALW